MSPLPVDSAEASGAMRWVVCAFPTEADAAAAARDLVEKRFAACAQRWPIRSVYLWDGRVEEAAETLLVLKTLPKQVGALFRRLKAIHPYDVPEILELDVARVDPGYLAYLYEVLGGGPPPYPLGEDPLGVRRPGSRRARGVHAPRGTRGRPRRRSR
ncbi:MAG TPA: divalent-cation tolerance protein CutA [Thermoplasmata archaeon]|nr:divalent-cation tolerance protein CutA [Thermoplasmata archaeon]